MATPRTWLTLYVKGVAMGTADAVPGVSGGTIALIVGLYERLIAAITAIELGRVRRIVAGVRPRNRADARAAFQETDGPFLVVLVAGVLSAVVVVLRLVDVLLTAFPVTTYGFFFGLIGASAVALFGSVDVGTPRRKAAALAGFVVAFLVSGYAATALGHALPVVFLAGAIAVSAMVLPGVSGSLLLVILGQYEYMTGALSAFVDGIVGVLTGNGGDELVAAAPPVVAFLAGGVVGVFTVAHGVRYALKRARAATLAFLVSLVVGALRAPVVEVSLRLAESGESWASATPRFVAAAALGTAVVLVLDRYAARIEY